MLGLVWGVVAGWWTPRGPLTSAQALWSIGISLLVGAGANFVSRSRWSMLAAPLGFAVAFDPTSTLTLRSEVRDTIDVTNYLRRRFGQAKIYLLGRSWGTTLGVVAAQQHPELYAAYIGTGQMVSQLATDRIFYRDTLVWARRTGKHGLVDELLRIGEPPYTRMLNYETALSHEHEVYPYDHSRNSEGEGGFSENLFVREYPLIDQVHAIGAFMDTFSVLYPQLQDIDFRRTVTRLAVPVYIVQGAHEARGRAEPFAEWFAALTAPTKDLKVLATAGHRPLFEQPKDFVEFMNTTVLEGTGSSQPAVEPTR